MDAPRLTPLAVIFDTSKMAGLCTQKKAMCLHVGSELIGKAILSGYQVSPL